MTNPGLKSTTWEKKVTFLTDKGLTTEEIDEAKRRVEEPPPVSAPSPATTSVSGAPPAAPSAPSYVAAPAAASASVYAAPAAMHAGGAPGAPAAAYSAGAPVGAIPTQAVMLLRRRLAELEHERSCYIEALGALGGGPAGGMAAAPVFQPAAPPAAAAPIYAPAGTAAPTPAYAPPPAQTAGAPPPAVVAAPAAPSPSTASGAARVPAPGAAPLAPGLREKEIAQAETFLKNPALASTPWEKKKEFLTGKGLLPAEIDEARRRVEGKGPDEAVAAAPAVSAPSPAAGAAATPARKPWETTAPSAAGAASTPAAAPSAGGEALRDDDPELVEILPTKKADDET